MKLAWACHICDKERPDELIGVTTGELRGLPGAEINIRYCKDNLQCEAEARSSACMGIFPKKKIVKKKWWQIWK